MASAIICSAVQESASREGQVATEGKCMTIPESFLSAKAGTTPTSSAHDRLERPVDQNMEREKSSKIAVEDMLTTIAKLKMTVQHNRVDYVMEKMECNRAKLVHYTGFLKDLANSWGEKCSLEAQPDMLTIRSQKAMCNFDPEADKEFKDEGASTSTPIIWGSGYGGRTAVRSVKLASQQNVPPYTTWIYLDRNQRMTEDQSVQGRRRIYYDPDGNETLIASDSEEEEIEEEEPKHDFSMGEDYIIWMAIQEQGPRDLWFEQVSQFIGVQRDEVQARYETLLKDAEKRQRNEGKIINSKVVSPSGRRKGSRDVGRPKETQAALEVDASQKYCSPGQNLEADEEEKIEAKDLVTAMDSFDNLFCRRCLVFDCRLHGCSQTLVHPSERQLPCSSDIDATKPCGPDCHLLPRATLGDKNLGHCVPGVTAQCEQVHSQGVASDVERLAKRQKTEAEVLWAKERVGNTGNPESESDTEKDASGHQDSQKKRHKQDASSRVTALLLKTKKLFTRSATRAALEERAAVDEVIDLVTQQFNGETSDLPNLVTNKAKMDTKKRISGIGKDGNELQADKMALEVGILNVSKDKKSSESAGLMDKWTALEKGLYEKGLQIFGKSSCLIARNMLKGCKTCAEVGEYIVGQEAAALRGAETDPHFCSDNLAYVWDVARARARFYGRRKGSRKLKFTLKSAGQSAIRKRMANGKDMPCRQYTPCGCLFSCGKQCPCQLNGTCCEKYCGCAKGCKNRFRGCHCAKSQCCSRQCPCFAAGRECDPDVCRNCWIGCGDGKMYGPPRRGDKYECHNMKLLLKQQQRVLLSRSDVAGWGAFLKNSVSKHEYLGEYTGELISHREADKRGKIYDRENSSFLFNLNDQFVLDACRKGDKLKFANHSPNPNCYAKVIMVAGDHRVGIFAKERILAGEELFYDYRYEADRAPVWARKGDEASNLKRDDVGQSSGRAQKVA